MRHSLPFTEKDNLYGVLKIMMIMIITDDDYKKNEKVIIGVTITPLLRLKKGKVFCQVSMVH